MRTLWLPCPRIRPICVRTAELELDFDRYGFVSVFSFAYRFPFMFPEHRYVELFLNSTERGSNGGYGGHMGGMGKLLCKWIKIFLASLVYMLLEGVLLIQMMGVVISNKTLLKYDPQVYSFFSFCSIYCRQSVVLWPWWSEYGRWLWWRL